MDYYGLGADSRKEDRTRYQLNTASVDARAGYRFTRALNAGIDFGYGAAHTGPVSGGDVPSIETKFDRTTAPGLFDDTTFHVVGRVRRIRHPRPVARPQERRLLRDRIQPLRRCGCGHLHPSPAGSRGSAVLPVLQPAARGGAVRQGPVRLHRPRRSRRPVLPAAATRGNFELRGFNDYRFADNNAFMAALEHRWYAFSGLEMALFVDAGKTVPEKGGVNFSGLNYSGGIGLRARVRGAVVLRMDVARSREGTRWIWSHERHLAETVLVAARRTCASLRARARAPRRRHWHRSRPGGGAEVLSRRPAAARADAAARARSRARNLSVLLEAVSATFGRPGERHPGKKVIAAQGVNTLGDVLDGAWHA